MTNDEEDYLLLDCALGQPTSETSQTEVGLPPSKISSQTGSPKAGHLGNLILLPREPRVPSSETKVAPTVGAHDSTKPKVSSGPAHVVADSPNAVRRSNFTAGWSAVGMPNFLE